MRGEGGRGARHLSSSRTLVPPALHLPRYVEARSVSSHKTASGDRSSGDGAADPGAADALAPTAAAPVAAAAADVVAGGINRAFSEKELRFVARVRAHRDPFALVVASMCPTIFGHETVKAGMLLGLFG